MICEGNENCEVNINNSNVKLDIRDDTKVTVDDKVVAGKPESKPEGMTLKELDKSLSGVQKQYLAILGKITNDQQKHYVINDFKLFLSILEGMDVGSEEFQELMKRKQGFRYRLSRQDAEEGVKTIYPSAFDKGRG